MRILSRYLLSGFIVTFLAALCVLTFVICIGVLFKVTDLLALGADWRPIARIFLFNIPAALEFTIPLSLLVATLLLFGRLSADGEITAMRACGLSTWRIAAPLLVFAAGMAGLCTYINTVVAPQSHYQRQAEIAVLRSRIGLALMEEGRYLTNLGDIQLYMGRKKGNQIWDVRVIDSRDPRVRREITAKTGIIHPGEGGSGIELELFDVRVSPFSADAPGDAQAQRWIVPLGNLLHKNSYRRTSVDLTIMDIWREVRSIRPDTPEAVRRRTKLRFQMHKHIVLSLLSFSFVVLGVPLGIKTQRRESSVGVGLSLLIVFACYLLVMAAESVVTRPALQPQYLLWIPFALTLAGGGVLLRRSR